MTTPTKPMEQGGSGIIAPALGVAAVSLGGLVAARMSVAYNSSDKDNRKSMDRITLILAVLGALGGVVAFLSVNSRSKKRKSNEEIAE